MHYFSAPPVDSIGGESPALYARRMHAMELTVRELLAAAQQERKAKLDAGRVDTVFKVGDRVLLRTKELLDAADIGKLQPRWDGPFTVTTCPSPNACTLALPPRMQCSRTVNVDLLQPFHERVNAPQAPDPVSDPGQEGEHEVELLLNRKDHLGGTLYLMRWRGHTSAYDEWLRAEELGHCQEKVAEYDAAARHRRAARARSSAAAGRRGRGHPRAGGGVDPSCGPTWVPVSATGRGSGGQGAGGAVDPVPLAGSGLCPGTGGPG